MSSLENKNNVDPTNQTEDKPESIAKPIHSSLKCITREDEKASKNELILNINQPNRDKEENIITDDNNRNNNQSKNIEENSNEKTSDSDKLKYDDCKWYLFLFLNIILGGVGTIIAGCKHGDTAMNGKNRKKELIILGIIQIILVPFCLIGNFWGCVHAYYYFESGHCKLQFNNSD